MSAQQQPQIRSLDDALTDELARTPSRQEAAANVIAAYPAAVVRRWLWEERQELLAARARILTSRARMDLAVAVLEGARPFTSAPRVVAAVGQPDPRYGWPAPYLDKFVRDCTVADAKEIADRYLRESDRLLARSQAWRETAAVAEARGVSTLGELEAAGIALPEGV